MKIYIYKAEYNEDDEVFRAQEVPIFFRLLFSQADLDAIYTAS